MKLEFDSQYNPKPLTFVLARRNGDKIGIIPASHIKSSFIFNSYHEITFSVYKNSKGMTEDFWKEIDDFKLVWIKEYDLWFELHVQISDGNVIAKQATAISLGQAELSQTNVYGLEINTETDIMRDDYSPTVFYNSADKKYSMLNRILSKTPHYSIRSVAVSLRNIQRTFSFDGSTVYDALMDVSSEIGCYIDFSVHSDANGKPNRSFSVYDLQSYCLECGERGEFTDQCTECGSTNITSGYGKDMNIFVSKKNLTDEIVFDTNEDSIKNCFKLESGDELMDATIVNCNPNGSSYLWDIPDFMKKDMPQKLVDKINAYDDLFEYYQKENITSLAPSIISKYNSLVAKYLPFKSDLANIPNKIVGFPNLMKEYYNTTDFELLLQHSLMPGIELEETSAYEQASKVTSQRISPVAVHSLATASKSTIDSAVLAMAKAQIDYRYQIKIISSSYASGMWRGAFIIKNYHDEEDAATATSISVSIIDTYGSYVQQMLDKSLANTTDYATDIVQMFNLGDTDFKNELKKYSLARLEAFLGSCEACLNILIEQGAANRETWITSDENIYDTLYAPYLAKQKYIQNEIDLRKSEIQTIIDVQNLVVTYRNQIQKSLNFENYLGIELWHTFIAYRREDTYTNSNYISDGLDNAELFRRALQFIDVAKKDLYRSANLQHSLSSTLKNLLAMKEFNGLTDKFELGNFLRIECNGHIYRVRLLTCDIDYDNLSTLEVSFSDVTDVHNMVTDIKNVIDNSKSMASSYDNVENQAEQGSSSRKHLDDWTTNGLALTSLKIINNADNQDYVFDEHGMLFRKYLPLTDTYDDEQLKIINSTIAITNDNWVTVKTAIGSHYYIDPLTNELVHAYGINGETIIGKIILGEQLGIYNSGATLQFNKNGLTVTNDITTFMLNPNTTNNILTIAVSNKDVLRVSENGLYITGEVVATAGKIGGLSITNNKLQINLSDVIGLNSAMTTIEGNAKAYADGAVASLTLSTTVNGNSATISLKASDKDGSSVNVTAGTINFTGMVQFSDLSTQGKTTINGSNITTGTISAQRIDANNLKVKAANITGSLTIGQLPSNVAVTSNIPTKLSQLTNDSGYKDYSGVVSIVNGTVTADFVNALGISAKSLLVQNSSGKTLISAGGNSVSIAGWNVNYNSLSTSYTGTVNGNYVNASMLLYSAQSSGNNWIEMWDYATERGMSLSKNGLLTANNANITGNINATSGKFGSSLYPFNIGTGSDSSNSPCIWSRSNSFAGMGGLGIVADNYVYIGGDGFSYYGAGNGDYNTAIRPGIVFCSGDNNWQGVQHRACEYSNVGINFMWGGTNNLRTVSSAINYIISSINVRQSDVYMSGSFSASSAISVTSDKNMKNSISFLDDRYSVLFDNLTSRLYKYNDGKSGRTHTGFIAQEVKEAMDKAEISTNEFAAYIQAVDGDGKPTLSIRYEEFIALNTWQIQKLKTRIALLEQTIVKMQEKT